MQVGDLVKCKYSFDKLMGVILETRKIKNSLGRLSEIQLNILKTVKDF